MLSLLESALADAGPDPTDCPLTATFFPLRLARTDRVRLQPWQRKKTTHKMRDTMELGGTGGLSGGQVNEKREASAIDGVLE